MSVTVATGLAIASLTSTVVGTVMKAGAASAAADAATGQANYNAQVARNNKIIADNSAADARERGALEATQQREASKQLQGKQRASLAGHGVTVDQDSALDLVADTAAVGELDALTIASNAEREALGFEAQGMNFESSARLSDFEAENAQAEGRFKVGSTLVSGFSSVASKWYGFNQDSVPGFK